MINLQKLEADLRELERREQQWNTAIYNMIENTRHKVGQDGYTEENREREIEAFYRQHRANYDPRLAERPLLNQVISVYESVSPEERTAIRDIFGKFSENGLLSYIVECAECLEAADDADIFRLGLIAASIENYAFDFRDTDMILAELAIAANNAGIDIEPHCTAIAQLCSDSWGRGGGFMKGKLADFHRYALRAKRVINYDWVRGVEIPSEDR
jgi:hypothetical protein